MENVPSRRIIKGRIVCGKCGSFLKATETRTILISKKPKKGFVSIPTYFSRVCNKCAMLNKLEGNGIQD